MYTLIAFIIIIIILVFLSWIYSVFKHKIHFFVTGLDSGFSFSDLPVLWNVSQLCELQNPSSLFFSMPALTKCMTKLSNQFAAEGSSEDENNQKLMSKLFDFRTKIQNQSDEKKGMVSTLSLEKGQKLRIILPGKGVFSSEIINNGNLITITIPKQKEIIPYSGEEWVNKVISVYLWKKGDARYVFDTTVVSAGIFMGKSSIQIKHSSNLVRTQKRKAVRAKCEIYGQLFIVKENTDINAIETKNGYRCLLQDISESGALIRIGGKGAENIKIKLQYNIQNMLILMYGVVRTVEYNKEINQSLLHFECISIEPAMRNEVLSYVYNILPDNEKEVIEALSQTEDDVEDAEKAGENLEEQITEMQQQEELNEMENRKESDSKVESASDTQLSSEYMQEVKPEPEMQFTSVSVAK